MTGPFREVSYVTGDVSADGRAILLRGWAELGLVDDGPDCLAIGEVNQQALFGRVAGSG